MINIEASDLRVKKTHRAIRNAFEELLMETDYDKLTVKALCERAMINRKTFYAHYAYLDELMEEYVNELSETYIRERGPSHGFENLPTRIRLFFQYLPNVPPLAEKLVMSHSGIGFFDKVGAMILTIAPEEISGIENTNPDVQRIILDYLNSACYTIYRSWILGGKKLPPEELSELAVTLICGDMNAILHFIGM